MPPRPYVFIMDPIERINIYADSTFVMMTEAQERGHALLYATPAGLELAGDQPWIEAHPIEVRRHPGDHFTLQSPRRLNLNDAQAVFMRKDPPFDIEYVMSTYILDRIDRRRVVLVNDPRALRDANEKVFAMEFPAITPETIIARRPARIREFIEAKGDVVVKPLIGAGGAGVVQLKRGDKNINAILDLLTQEGRNLIAAQVFLPRVTEGDRRVLLIDGEPVGVINRRPRADDLRSNMHVGGTAEAAQLSDRDREISAVIGPELRRRGLVFVGIDVIDGWLTEINVTSPTGIQEVNRFDGVEIEALLLDWVERRVAELGQ